MATVIAGDVPITIKVDNGDKLATVALVVSVVALIATILQVLQQYYASAVGYSNCDEKVMGMWHKSKQRLVRIEELRFEVRFEAPVIFVAPPTNKRGPVPDKPIYTIDGSPESQRDTRAQIDRDDHGGGRRLTAKEQKDREKDSIHTADNERATWVNMLLALQRMEKESMEWQAREFALNPPTGRRLAGRETHTLAVQVQRKLRSWDTMPSNVKKPYATTTFCHLIEMTAMLGLHWKEFDRSHDRYRAEGNGFLISGGHVSDLGIMFTFHISAKSHFEENRVIPVDEVKELCFGYVPTIFGRDDRKDSAGGAGVRRIEEPEKAHARDDVDDDVDGAAGGALGLADLPESRELLRLGSFTEIAETLTLLKCNQNTVNYFAHGKAAKHVHLFSVVFELIGMIGKTLHIKNSFFRMLPNPTPYRWEDKSFSLRRLLRSFKHAIADDELSQKCEHMHSIQEHIVAIETHSRRPAPRQQGPGQQQQQQTPMNLALLDSLHAALDCCDNYLRQEFPAWFVLMILRIHIEEVLKNLNTPPGGKSGKKGHGAEPLSAVSGRHPSLAQHVLGSGSSSSSGRGRGCHGSRSSSRSPSNSDSSSSSNSSDSSDESHLRPPTFADLDAATTDIKQDLFMQIYFDVIRPRVLEQYKVPRRVGTTQYVRLMAANAAPVAANSNEGLPPFHHHNHAGFFDNHHIRQPSASSLPASVALRGSTSPTPTPEPPQQPERVATAATTAAAGPSTTASTPPAVAVSGPTPSSSTPAVTGPAADMHCDSSSASGPSPHAHPGLPHAHTTPLLLAAQQPAAAGGGSSNTVVETMHGVTLQPLLTPTTSLGPRGPLGHRRQVPSMAGSLDDTRSLMDGLGSGGGGGQSGRSSRAAFMMIGDGTGCDVEEMDIRANSVWCTLVFRSLCWLMLHDFHRRDVQLPGISELWGSRLPVYIG